MLVSNLSKDALILQNIVGTLAQIKLTGAANQPLVIDDKATCVGEGLYEFTFDDLIEISLDGLVNLSIASTPLATVDFYTDEARTDLLFSQNSTDNPSNFSIANGAMRYTPPDGLLNDADGISTTMAQPLYWVTVTLCDGSVKKLAYRNVDNLLFQNVLVTSKPDPKFVTNENCCIVYPKGQRVEVRPNNDAIDYVILDYVLYLQLIVYQWDKLSESERVMKCYSFNNLVRNALYADSTRGGHCTFFSKDLDETYVGNIDLRPGETVLKGSVRVQCCYQANAY